MRSDVIQDIILKKKDSAALLDIPPDPDPPDTKELEAQIMNLNKRIYAAETQAIYSKYPANTALSMLPWMAGGIAFFTWLCMKCFTLKKREHEIFMSQIFYTCYGKCVGKDRYIGDNDSYSRLLLKTEDMKIYEKEVFSSLFDKVNIGDTLLLVSLDNGIDNEIDDGIDDGIDNGIEIDRIYTNLDETHRGQRPYKKHHRKSGSEMCDRRRI